MAAINAFIAHSFNEEDFDIVNTFLKFFNGLKGMIDFDWDHAEKAELKALSDKVREKMEGKNLFIGILTKKGFKVDPKNLKKFFGQLHGPDRIFEYGASEWIVQESGYGLATCGKLLFLIEEGVLLSAGLHGDREYVPFTRNNPESCFTKIIEMIGSIMPRISIGQNISDKSIAPKIEEAKPEETKEDQLEAKSNEESWFNSYAQLHSLIVDKKKYKEAENLLPNIIEKFKDNVELDHIFWKSSIYEMLCISGESKGFRELEKLSEVYADNPLPFRFLGDSFLHYKNYSDAALSYKKASDRCQKLKSRLYYLGRASDAYVKDNRNDDAYDLIYQQLNALIDKPEYHSQIFKQLALIAKKTEDDKLFFSFGEKYLKHEPADSEMRFSIAYRYSEVGKNDFALYHYKILCESNASGTNWNNIGVVYEQLEMNNNAVKAFKAATENFEETLAMANLANKYIKQGFVDNAKILLDRARLSPEYHKNVDINYAEISKITDYENSKEKELLNYSENEKSFLINFAEAYAMPFNAPIVATWKTTHGNLKIDEQGDKITGICEIIPTEPIGVASQVNALTGLGIGFPSFKKKIVKVKGQKKNRGVIYELSVRVEGGSLLSLGDRSEEYSGYMIVSKELNEINVMEIQKDKTELSFYTMNKLEA